MASGTTEFQKGIRSTSEFMEPIVLDPSDRAASEELARTLSTYGLALVRSAYFKPDVRARFLDRFTDYICSNLTLRGGRLAIDMNPADLRRDLGFQYGPTPVGEETALCAQKDNHLRCKAFVDRLEPRFQPFTIPGAEYPDRKGRFMAHLITYSGAFNGNEAPVSPHRGDRVGVLEADSGTVVIADPANVVPSFFDGRLSEEWRRVVNDFGMMMLNPLTEISQMLAVGIGLPRSYFTSLMNNGHHKVAPTFASLYDFRDPGTVQAALHEDIDVFAIHAQGTHSGLYVYTETGERLRVNVPSGCYLVQAGRQLYLKMRSMQRAGEISAPSIKPGWHEVIVTPDAVEWTERDVAEIDSIIARDDIDESAKLAAVRPIYKRCLRVSCTFFYHFGDDTTLVYALPEGELEEDTFPEGTRIQRYIGLELGFIKLQK